MDMSSVCFLLAFIVASLYARAADPSTERSVDDDIPKVLPSTSATIPQKSSEESIMDDSCFLAFTAGSLHSRVAEVAAAKLADKNSRFESDTVAAVGNNSTRALDTFASSTETNSEDSLMDNLLYRELQWEFTRMKERLAVSVNDLGVDGVYLFGSPATMAKNKTIRIEAHKMATWYVSKFCDTLYPRIDEWPDEFSDSMEFTIYSSLLKTTDECSVLLRNATLEYARSAYSSEALGHLKDLVYKKFAEMVGSTEKDVQEEVFTTAVEAGTLKRFMHHFPDTFKPYPYEVTFDGIVEIMKNEWMNASASVLLAREFQIFDNLAHLPAHESDQYMSPLGEAQVQKYQWLLHLFRKAWPAILRTKDAEAIGDLTGLVRLLGARQWASDGVRFLNRHIVNSDGSCSVDWKELESANDMYGVLHPTWMCTLAFTRPLTYEEFMLL